MSCEHEVRFTIKPTDDACRFHFDVRAYKDRIVAPDEYSGATVVTPSSETQVLETKDRLIRDDITVEGITGTQTITENGMYDVVGDKSVVVDVPQKWDINSIADGSEPSGAITLDTATGIRDWGFCKCSSLTAVTGENVETIGEYAFYNASNLQVVHFPKCKTIGQQSFRDAKVGGDFASQFPVVESIGDRAFQNTGYIDLHLPETLKTLTGRSFNNVFNLKKVYFQGTPTSIGNAFDEWPSPHITDIYVPWSEGAVSGAPWGATSATIHYDTVYDSEWNVISST